MDIREKLVEQLNWWATECDRTNHGCQASKLLVAAAKYIANNVKVQEWISVSERLPEVARRVLVTDGENVSFGYVLNYERKDLNPWCTQSPCLPHTTTHWMPLPTPPKGE